MIIRKIITVFAFLPLLLTSCELFEDGEIKDYMGDYVVDGASEKTYHVSWNQKTLINEKDLAVGIKYLTINEDKSVVYSSSEGEENKGNIRCFKEFCRFYSTPLESGYQFYKRYDNSLYYEYESFHFGVDYDITYRSIVLKKM